MTLLVSMEDSEIEAIFTLLKCFIESRNKHGRILTISSMQKRISQLMIETKPEHETPEQLEKRKRDIKWHVQCELL